MEEIKRCGKSYLLFKLYYEYLLSIGVDKSRIIKIELDSDEYEDLADAKKLGVYIREQIKDNDMYYVFLDEVQFVDGFEIRQPQSHWIILCLKYNGQIFYNMVL